MITLRKAGLTGFFLLSMAPSFAMAETAAHLNLALRAEPSATRVLQAYCQRIAPGVAITAISLPTDDRPVPALLHARFALAPDETIRTRHVSLRCGMLVLSDAWNWYIPERLTPEMNRELGTSTTPFGRVVAALRFHREHISSETTSLPAGILLRNTAMLKRGRDNLPFSLVVENYLTQGFSAFQAPTTTNVPRGDETP